MLHVVEEAMVPVHAGIAGDKGSPLYSKELDVHGGRCRSPLLLLWIGFGSI